MVEDDGLQAQVSVGLSYLGSNWWCGVGAERG